MSNLFLLEFARRSHFVSRTELDGTQNADLQLVIANKSVHSQNEYQTTSSHDDTPNNNSLQRDPNFPKILVDLEHYTISKTCLDNRRKSAFFPRCSCNRYKVECECLKKELSAALINAECNRTLRSAKEKP